MLSKKKTLSRQKKSREGVHVPLKVHDANTATSSGKKVSPKPEKLRGAATLEQRIEFWVSDLMEFKSNKSNKLQHRIEFCPLDEAPYLSSFYYDSEEAKRILSRQMPDGKKLGEVWQKEIKGVVGSGKLPCTSHHLAPIIKKAYGLHDGYLTSKPFKATKKAWLKNVNDSWG